jgi:hypothetical protein
MGSPETWKEVGQTDSSVSAAGSLEDLVAMKTGLGLG